MKYLRKAGQAFRKYEILSLRLNVKYPSDMKYSSSTNVIYTHKPDIQPEEKVR